MVLFVAIAVVPILVAARLEHRDSEADPGRAGVLPLRSVRCAPGSPAVANYHAAQVRLARERLGRAA